MTRILTAAVLVALVASPALAEDNDDAETLIREATVTLLPARCAGVIVGEGSHVLTAAHCLDDGENGLQLELYDGRRIAARTVVVDHDHDLALLAPTEDVGPGLDVALDLPLIGEPVFFVGRNDVPIAMQLALIDDLRPCPSLPAVPEAIFTTIEGRKGDSGSPVVDFDLEVVGLIHGGAVCNIVTPVAGWAPAANGALD